jgi:hypothetical protein
MMDDERLTWTKSSRCANGGCIEVASVTARRLVRDSKEDNGPILSFSPEAFDAFLEAVRADELHA